MRIHELADRKGTAGKWCSVDRGVRGWCNVTRHIYHYETEMLSFVVADDGLWDGDPDTVDYSIGHGSVSDQNGMNNLFARCAMNLVYRRDIRGGGARIETLQSPHYRYRITRDDMRARAERSVSVSEVLNSWPMKTYALD